MPTDTTYTAEQVAQAARALRNASGKAEERFSATQVVSMLGDEVQTLRTQGLSNAEIAAQFQRSGIEVTAEQIEIAATEPRPWG